MSRTTIFRVTRGSSFSVTQSFASTWILSKNWCLTRCWSPWPLARRSLRRKSKLPQSRLGIIFTKMPSKVIFWIPSEFASGMVTVIAQEGVLSMADLFSYLLPYPASVLRRTLIPNSNFCLSIVGLWSQISTSFLNVRLDSHMVLQQLLFQPNWER